LPPAGFAARFFLALNLVASGCFGAKDRLGKRVLFCLEGNLVDVMETGWRWMDSGWLISLGTSTVMSPLDGFWMADIARHVNCNVPPANKSEPVMIGEVEED
jgi:hypothetical protein